MMEKTKAKFILLSLIILATSLHYAPAAFSQGPEQGSLRTDLILIDSSRTKNNTVTAFAYEKDGADYVFSGGDGGYVDVFKLSATGSLTPIDTYELHNKKGPSRGLVADNIDGTDYLFVGNKGSHAVEVFQIHANGQLSRAFILKDTEDTYLGTVITLHVIHMKTASYLFVGGLEETPGLSCFKIHSDGKLVHVQSLKDDEKIHTDGIIGMYSHKIGDKTFLFTGGFQDNGVSSFSISEDGHFANVNNIADNTSDRYLTGAYPVDGVTLGGNHYVIVGHRHHKYYKRLDFIKEKDFVYHGDGVSVFKVNQKGELIPHYVLVDNEHTQLSGQTRIEVLAVNDKEAIVAVGTRDDKSIQLCQLDEKGKLTPLGIMETGYPIYYGMASQKIGETLFFLAGSVDNGVKKLYSYKTQIAGAKLLRHIVGFKFKEEVRTEQIDEAVFKFVQLQNDIPEIIDVEWGANKSKQGFDKGFTHCFTFTFKNEQDRDTYLEHQAHLDLVEKVRPLLADILVMDYWVEMK